MPVWSKHILGAYNLQVRHPRYVLYNQQNVCINIQSHTTLY